MINQIFGINFIGFLKKGGIHIKKKNRGKFTASAKRAGKTVQQYAKDVLADPNATPLQKKRANFARNTAKWKHQEGGILKLSPEELKYLEWSKRTPKLKKEYRINRAKSYLLSGPNITNFWEAFQSYIGNRDPKNPHLNTGEAPTPGITKSSNIIRLYRATGTSGKFKPSLDGLKEFSGKWFTSNPNKPQRYASMTIKRAKQEGVNNPIELQYVDIPSNDINKYKASVILKDRKDVEYEPLEDYLIPLDYPRKRIPLEGYTGNILLDSRKKLPIQFKKGGIIKYLNPSSLFNKARTLAQAKNI